MKTHLSGTVQKHGYPKSKTLKNVRVTAAPTTPPKVCDTTSSAMKSSSRSATQARIRERYGWKG